jgi:hypothetical protein
MMTSSWLSLKPIMGCVFPGELMICAYYPLIDYSIPKFISAPETPPYVKTARRRSIGAAAASLGHLSGR